MPFDVFTAQVVPAFGDSWAKASRLLLADPVEKETIDILTRLAGKGEIRNPVIISHPNPVSPRSRVLDGMHRVIAYNRAGLPIPYCTGYPAPSSLGFLHVELELPPITENNLDLLFSLLRSFPVNETYWADTSIVGSTGYGTHIVTSAYYRIPENSTVEEYTGLLRAALRSRVSVFPDIDISISFEELE